MHLNNINLSMIEKDNLNTTRPKKKLYKFLLKI